MNIIFITIAYPRSSSESNLYSDLMEEFAEHGHKVYVACSIESRFVTETNLTINNGISVLQIRTGNITSNPSYIAKGFALLQIQAQFIHAINIHFHSITFDLIIYSTPPIQFNRIIRYLKRKSEVGTYLLLKDIFPQNAIDIELLSKWSPVYWYFRRKEKETYKLSDRIGCMSPANVKYLLKNNPFLLPEKVEVCPNSLKDRGSLCELERIAIRSKIRKDYEFSVDDLVLVYGGNLGAAQGLGFLKNIFQKYKNIQNVKFLIVGEGTWFRRINEFVNSETYKNVVIQSRISSLKFREILIASDIGLIFLNPKFTIPNFPSRLNSYLEAGLPVIACTDLVSDVGDVVEHAGCGCKVLSGDLYGFDTAIRNLAESPQTLQSKAANARKLFESTYTVQNTYSIIMNHLK